MNSSRAIASTVHIGLWLVVGLVGLANIQGYRHVVEHPSECPSVWVDGQSVGVMPFESGVYECVVERGDGTFNIPVGERQGLMPWWLAAVVIVGAIVGYRSDQPRRVLSERTEDQAPTRPVEGQTHDLLDRPDATRLIETTLADVESVWTDDDEERSEIDRMAEEYWPVEVEERHERWLRGRPGPDPPDPVATRDMLNVIEPKELVRLDYTESFTLQEFEQMKRGVIPHSMDDKWFIYEEDMTLRFHRSWTGRCMYVVEFAIRGDEVAVENAFFDPHVDAEGTHTDLGDETEWLNRAIRYLCLKVGNRWEQ